MTNIVKKKYKTNDSINLCSRPARFAYFLINEKIKKQFFIKKTVKNITTLLIKFAVNQLEKIL